MLSSFRLIPPSHKSAHFEFVEIHNPKKPVPAALRKKIRKHVAGQRDNWTGYTSQHSPATVAEKDARVKTRDHSLARRVGEARADVHAGNDEFKELRHDASPLALVPFPNSSVQTSSIPKSIDVVNDFIVLRNACNFDILSLSGLMTFDTNRGTIHDIATRPEQLKDILHSRQSRPSYFSLIPSRYGASTCLDDAVVCIAHRVGEYLQGYLSCPTPRTMALYGRALTKVNRALSDPWLRLQVDVLAAVSILSVYELLSEGRELAWIQHMDGTAKLLELRGPQGCSDEFGKRLFEAHVGSIIVESILSNKQAFFEDAAWDSVFESLIETSRPAARLTTDLWKIMRDMPGLLARVTALVCGNHDTCDIKEVEVVAAQASSTENRYLTWRVELENHLQTEQGRLIPKDQKQELHAIFLTGTLLVRRAHAALSSTARANDSQTVNIALHLLAMLGTTSVDPAIKTLFLPQKSKVALAIFATTDRWQNYNSSLHHHDHTAQIELIDKDVFKEWCALWGKSTTTCSTSSITEYTSHKQFLSKIHDSTYSQWSHPTTIPAPMDPY